jgi:L-lactate dehydrogenase complex protein LldG
MNARSRVLALIRTRLGKRVEASVDELDSVRGHIAAHPRNAAPQDSYDVLTRFGERAQALASSVEAVSIAQVPARVAAYLHQYALPMQLVCWDEFAALDWAAAGLAVEARAARGDDLVGLTGAYCGIAETGTLMTLSGPHTPPSVSLLPETHFAVLSRRRIVRSMEDAWTLLRGEVTGMPRAVSFISGPSRTADIEQTVTLGAHGPYRVHILIAD